MAFETRDVRGWLMDLLAPYLEPCSAPDPGRHANKSGRELLARVASPDDALDRLPRAFGLICNNTSDEDHQVIAARLLELTRRRDSMLETWTALHTRFPDNQIAFRLCLRWHRRAGRVEAGCRLAEKLETDCGSPPEHLLKVAELWCELDKHTVSDDLFRAAIAKIPKAAKPRLLFAKRLSSRGEFVAAAEALAPLDAKQLSATAVAIVERVECARKAMQSLSPDAGDAVCTTAAALKSALLLFQNRQLAAPAQDRSGGIMFVTGSLGAGGAERQLTRLASELEIRHCAAEPVAGVLLAGQISVAVGNASRASGNDFFRKQVEQAGLAFTDLSRTTPAEITPDLLGRQILVDLLPILPKSTVFGLERLTPVLLNAHPEVAYIWQDGAVLTAVLAALVAEVPRIVISLRGMPPNLRPNLAKDEFRDMYQTLARLPGVSFTSNNHPSADAYCAWLGLSTDTFTIIPNAAVPASTASTAKEARHWSDFAQRTRDANLTLGGVFRFEANKRPKLWIEFAAAALQANPRFRFVLVGEGTEYSACREYADELGLKNRILFAGHSHNVGFWLSKMDILSLLSEHEGLPNVLIEAQISGVPVLATPAGGAAETFEPGLTGMLLEDAKSPCAKDYVSKLLAMSNDRDRLQLMSAAAKTRADELFAVERVLAHTIAHFKGQQVRVDTLPNRRPDRLDKIA